MAVFRIERTRDYTVMSNHHLRNANLSLKAKGLLSMMLSLPEDWNYTTRGLAKICKEGVDAIGAALRELEAAGYIVRHKLRDRQGRISDTEYVIYEQPQLRKPDTDSPDMVIDDSEEALTLSDDRIEKAVRQNHVRLVIIDPVQAFIGADVDMNRANEVRPVFRKLGMIAEKTGCAIVLIGHLNKSSGTQSTYRGLGSIDIMAAVRSLIFIGKVRKDPTTRVLIHEKSSLAPPGETMAFKLGDEEGFRWVGAYEISADELLDGKEGKATETKLERGAKLIRELLADKKEISIRELDEKAKEQGISGRTMRDVRSRMKNELEYRVNEKQENSIRLKE